MRLRRRVTAQPADAVAATRIAAVAEHAGAPVSEVLREVADFRLALETDLLIAAAAADAGEAQIASDVVDSELAELASFQERVLDRLADAAVQEELSGRRAARVKAERNRTRHVRLAGVAAAVLGLVGGGFASQVTERAPAVEQVALAEAEEQLDVLARATFSGSNESVEARAEELHDTLEALIESHADDDPEIALQIARILHEEQALLDQRPTTDATVIARVAALAKHLRRLAPHSIRGTIAPLIPLTESRPKQKASDKRDAKASPAAKPSPSPTTASPTPTPSPTPTRASSSPSPSEDDPAPFSSVSP